MNERKSNRLGESFRHKSCTAWDIQEKCHWTFALLAYSAPEHSTESLSSNSSRMPHFSCISSHSAFLPSFNARKSAISQRFSLRISLRCQDHAQQKANEHIKRARDNLASCATSRKWTQTFQIVEIHKMRTTRLYLEQTPAGSFKNELFTTLMMRSVAATYTDSYIIMQAACSTLRQGKGSSELYADQNSKPALQPLRAHESYSHTHSQRAGKSDSWRDDVNLLCLE